jgi:hypothetical protein
MRLPSLASVLAILAAALAVASVVWWFGTREPSRPAPGASLAVLRDSVLRVRVEDSIRLVGRVDSILRLRDSSLSVEFARKAAALRPRIIRLPGVTDTVRDTSVVRDSACVDGGDARAVLLGLAACEADRDAFRGELVVCQASDSAKARELRERPTSCHGWSAFGLGFGAGATTAAGACVLLR